MKATAVIFRIFFIVFFISLGFYSCSHDGSDEINPFPNDTFGKNTTEVLLTDNLVKEWRLVNIYDENNIGIPVHEWTDCEKSEILTFHSDNTFSFSCCDTCASFYLWNIIVEKGKKFIYIESVNSSKATTPWTGKEVVVHFLSAYEMILEINGIKHEYIPYFLENCDPGDYY